MAVFDISGFKKPDLRLQNIFFELYLLKEFLQTIENQMEQLQKEKRQQVDAEIEKFNLQYGDPEYHELNTEYKAMINYVLPRLFRGTFLIALYALYESAIIEIARKMAEKTKQEISINEFRVSKRNRNRGFLKKAEKYYKDILNFELYSKEKKPEWEKIEMLADLRHAFAHANGLLEMLKNDKARNKIKERERQNKGISFSHEKHRYIVCDAKIVRDIFDAVNGSLEDLILRYKDWDDKKTDGL